MTIVNIHGGCVRLDRAAEPFGASRATGILILGASGAGKSTLVLDLLARGAALVADDRVELSVHTGRLQACAPAALEGLLEVRGVGIVKLPHTRSVHVDLVVDLVPEGVVPRLPEPARWPPPEPLASETQELPHFLRLSAVDAANRIVLAAAAFSKGLLRE
jgi:serine kinase of HPr protein (carbohydrate metabolism regulator)